MGRNEAGKEESRGVNGENGDWRDVQIAQAEKKWDVMRRGKRRAAEQMKKIERGWGMCKVR